MGRKTPVSFNLQKYFEKHCSAWPVMSAQQNTKTR